MRSDSSAESDDDSSTAGMRAAICGGREGRGGEGMGGKEGTGG